MVWLSHPGTAVKERIMLERAGGAELLIHGSWEAERERAGDKIAPGLDPSDQF